MALTCLRTGVRVATLPDTVVPRPIILIGAAIPLDMETALGNKVLGVNTLRGYGGGSSQHNDNRGIRDHHRHRRSWI